MGCVTGFLLAGISHSTFASAPLLGSTAEIWKRDVDGNSVFAAVAEDRLIALCIEVDGRGNWLPVHSLRDMTFPKLDEITFVRGMGFSQSEELIPSPGHWGLSLSIETEVEVENMLVEGPEHYFVFEDGRLVYQVVRRLVPVEDNPGVSTIREERTALDDAQIRHAPCRRD
jgi:hypothetical protein